MQTETNTASVAERVIPNPPGGGSWTFDEVSWAWISNDPIPASQPVVSDNAAPVSAEQEQ